MKTKILTLEQSFGSPEISDEEVWEMQAMAAFAIEHSNSPSALAARNYFRRDELPPQAQELLNTYDQAFVGGD